MKNKKYHTVATVPKSKRKIVERRCKIYAINIQIHDSPSSRLNIGNSIISGGVKIV
jgi:hypothetical protein